MKQKLWTSYRRYQDKINFIGIIIIFGLATGIFFYLKQDSMLKASLNLDLIEVFSGKVFSFQNIIYHLIILSIIILSSFILIGLPLLIIYIFCESLALGFLIPLFVSSFKLSSIGVLISYFIFTKLFFYILLIIFFISILKFTKSYLYHFRFKKNSYKKSLKITVIIACLIIINDFLIYFLANPILTFILV